MITPSFAARAGLGAGLVLLCAGAVAQPAPPPEAVAACNGKADGAVVSYTGRNGDTVTGTCSRMGSVLAARTPAPPPPAPGGLPPPQ